SRRPLGLVIVGGLVVSQLLTLYITPVIYHWLEWFQEHVLDRVPFLRSAHFHEHEFTHKPDRAHPAPVATSEGEPFRRRGKTFRCCPFSGRHSSQNLAHLHGTVNSR